MLRLAVAATLAAHLFSPSHASPCSQVELPPVDIALFEATVQREVLKSLDDEGGTWTLLGPMPVSSSEFSVTVVDGLIYSVGGFLSANQDKLLIYDPETDSWTEGAPVPQPTHHAGVEVAANSRKLIVKGLAAGTTFTFRVRAINDAGPSDYSNERTITTPAS